MLAIALTACGGHQEKSQAGAASQTQADVARATLQEKADALARSASTPPKDDKKQQAHK